MNLWRECAKIGRQLKFYDLDRGIMQIIKQLSFDCTLEIATYIRQHLLPLATPEKSKCAFGRTQIWLKAEPNYRSRKYMEAHSDERLWQFIKRIDPLAACAQIYAGARGIDWHRDASYAKPTAHIVNLGRVTLQIKTETAQSLALISAAEKSYASTPNACIEQLILLLSALVSGSGKLRLMWMTRQTGTRSERN